MQSIKRSACIICNNTSLEPIGSFEHFPIMAISNEMIDEHYYTMAPIYCRECGCMQLQELVDPLILYSNIYTNATFSKTWQEHHSFFSRFIINNTEEDSFLEVGANKGDLYKYMSSARDIEHTVLDMFKSSDLPKEIAFIEGNCETFNFTGFKTVILSHVFEHLYDPRAFLENMRKSNVSTVFISIPDFESLLTDKSICILNSQHTFFCSDAHIKWLFSQYNYRCNEYYRYGGCFKSCMYKFTLEAGTVDSVIVPHPISLFKEIYVDKVSYIRTMYIPPNTYIIPSGIYGQYIYYFSNYKENIMGFIDNNSQRHNKELYGTGKKVYSPLCIDYTKSTVIVCDCIYKEELVQDLKKISTSIHFIIM